MATATTTRPTFTIYAVAPTANQTSLEIESLAIASGLNTFISGTAFMLAAAKALADDMEQPFVNAIRKVADDLGNGKKIYYSFDQTSGEYTFLSSQAGTSGDRGEFTYVTTPTACTCKAGEHGRMCRHQATATLINAVMAFAKAGKTVHQARGWWRANVMDNQVLHLN